MPRKLALLSYLLVIFCAGCGTQNLLTIQDTYFRTDQDYTFAIYNSQNQLITYPILNFNSKLNLLDTTHKLSEQIGLTTKLCEEIDRRQQSDLLGDCKAVNRTKKQRNEITDVYVLSHGWNYTVKESLENYQRYMDLISSIKRPSKDFNPYFIFITWPSAVRPITDLIRAVLPLGLEYPITPFTKTIDNTVFFFPTLWKQSFNAYENGAGSSIERRFDISTKRELFKANRPFGTNGRDISVALILYELLSIRQERIDKFPKRPPYNIHLVGHSFGAKLLTHAASQALEWRILHAIEEEKERSAVGSIRDTQKCKNENPEETCEKDLEKSKEISDERIRGMATRELKLTSSIESLLLFNPAMDILEFDLTLPEDKREFITRKGIVYSNSDYPNGLLYGLSQIPFNTAGTQAVNSLIGGLAKRHYRLSWFEKDEETGREYLNTKKFFITPFMWSAQVLYAGLIPAISAIVWGGAKATNLVMNYGYHLEANDTFLPREPGSLEYLRRLFNGAHFFLPIDKFVQGAPESQFGIFRSNFPALGRTGLNEDGLGGSLFGLLWEQDPSSRISADDFCTLSSKTGKLPTDFRQLNSKLTYSIDGSEILNSQLPPVGSHGDIRESEIVGCPKQFRGSDLKNPTSFATWLRDARDPVSEYFNSQMSSETRQLLDGYDGSSPLSELLQTALIHELNDLLEDDLLYDEKRFKSVTFREETERLIQNEKARRLNQQDPRREHLASLNWLLLEDAYAEKIAQKRVILEKRHFAVNFVYNFTTVLQFSDSPMNYPGNLSSKQEKREFHEPR